MSEPSETIRKIAQKFPANEETSILTDIHLRVSQDSGELLAFDDEEQEINRCVIEQWIDNKDENFYDSVTIILRNELKRNNKIVDNMGILKPYELKRNNKIVDNMGILKPYNFVLEDDDKEPIAELYLADDDTVIIGGDLMTGLDEDLDAFLDDLFKD